MHELILGSASPRRQELLNKMGFEFRVEVKETEEIVPDSLPAESVAEAIALKKSEAFGNLPEAHTLITADTVVVLEDSILGKPVDTEDALSMLLKLQGNWHVVFTAVVIRTNKQTISFTDSARVHILPMTEEEIKNYLRKDQPFDKAGSYGVQDWLGINFIDAMEGSFFTVMGLPTARLFAELKKLLGQ